MPPKLAPPYRYASGAWPLPVLGSGDLRTCEISMCISYGGTAARVPALVAGKGPLVPASPRREASLYTCPALRKESGAFLLATAVSGCVGSHRSRRRCPVLIQMIGVGAIRRRST